MFIWNLPNNSERLVLLLSSFYRWQNKTCPLVLLPLKSFPALRWQSQDGGLGGRRVHISSQLGHLLGTGRNPWVTGLDVVGREGGGKVEAGWMGPVPLRGGWGRGGVPCSGWAQPQWGDQQEWREALGRAEDQKGMWPVFPLPAWTPESLVRSQA